MMKILKLFACSLLLAGIFAHPLLAQRYQFPQEAEKFITYASDLLNNTKKAKSMEAAEIFAAVWGGKLSTEAKNQIMDLSQKLVAKRATPASDYTPFFRSIANALNEQNLSAAQINSYLDLCTNVVEKQQIREIRLFFSRMSQFFLRKFLHNNRFSRVYANGSFEFQYVDGVNEQLQAEYQSSDINNSEEAAAIPEITGPVIKFNSLDLTIATSFDSTGVKKTKGLFLIISNKFLGKGGRFDWGSVDLNPEEVFCEFDTYVYNVAKPVLKASNVTLRYTLLLSSSIKGEFEYVSRPKKNVYLAKYPKFISYSNNVEISQFGQDLQYQGGFTLEGRNIYSSSKNPNAFSTITGVKDYTAAFKAIARKFNINDSTIVAPNVIFSLYMGESDSLYHSDLQFKYLKENNEIQLVRDRNTSAGTTPFINNHHEFYINADVIKYNLEKDSLDIYMLSGAQELRPAVFESFDYFNKARYNEMIGLYNFHPIKLFTKYGQKVGSTEFSIAQMAKDYRRNQGILHSVANSLEARAYLEYDDLSGMVRLGKRINQTDSADVFLSSVERIDRGIGISQDSAIYRAYDHDNFIIQSSVKGGPNASLNRSDNELVIRGISSFPVSEALNVNIIPDSSSQSVTVYGGRNLYMKKGEITVGNFRFIGQNFFLLYEEFLLEMPQIDNILFNIQDTISGDGEWHEYGGEINFKPGRVIINDHLNKSGRKRGEIAETGDFYESYPKLSIPEGGEVYFSTDYRQDYAYDSTLAVFQLYEIDMDSLNTKVPIFPGIFKSNIFPHFEEDLIPMDYPDLTMGFRHTPPKAGYPLYPGSKLIKDAHIKFNRELVMNRDGLSSGGLLSYLSTSLDAPEFIFMPDSITSDNIAFEVAPSLFNGAEFAQANGKTAQLRWLVDEDRMVITNKDEITRLEDSRKALAPGAFEQRYKDKLFTLYGDENPMTLRGFLTVSADGLKGEGNLIRKDFTILSVSEEPFRFAQSKFTANNVEFRINSQIRDPYEFDKGYFYTNNKAVLLGNFVDLDFDLGQGKAGIKPDEEFIDFTSLTLPYSEYRTSIKEALWDLSKRTIEMNGDSTSFFTSTIFGSEDFNEENLRFNASYALYDIQDLSMQVEGIPFINSADASIVPKDGKAVILKDAEMQELKEALVLIDTLNRYHRLFDGNMKINSRLDFEGDATYQFVNVQKDTFNVKFDKFELVVDEDVTRKKKREATKGGKIPRYTFAQGTVGEADNFYITSRVLYKGQIKMYANRRNLSLDGFIKLDLTTSSDFNDWIPYQSDKGDSVFLAVDEKLVVDNQVITSGLHFSDGSNDLYNTFLSPKRSDQDKDIFLASGILDYNPGIEEFKISPKERREGGYSGNRLIFDDPNSSIFLEGKFNFTDEILSRYVNISGTGRINIKEKTYDFDNFIVFDLPVDFKAVAMMQSEINQIMPPTTFSLMKNDPLNNKIASITGENDFKKFEESIGVRAIPLPEISKTLKKTFVFSKANMTWSDEYKTLYSKGALHLLSVFEKIYDADVTGFIEIRKRAEGDALAVYIQPDPDVWYFYEIEDEVTYALSSDETFNELVESKGVELSSIDKKEAFINKFRALYGAADLPRSKKKDEEKAKDKKKAEEEEEEEEDDGF